jgi:Bacterial regulatory helix-turn-helix protein, lysR family
MPKALGITTSTISRRVGRFEDELGVIVFERGHAGIRLAMDFMSRLLSPYDLNPLALNPLRDVLAVLMAKRADGRACLRSSRRADR